MSDMSDNTKKYTAVIMLGLAIVPAGVFYLLSPSESEPAEQGMSDTALATPKDVTCALPPITEPTSSTTATEFMEWLTYHDPNEWYTYNDSKYHFRIDYPCYLSVLHEDQYIAFVLAEYDGPGGPGSGIFIEPTSFLKPEEEVARMNKERETEFTNTIYRTVIDGSITLNGYSGIVTHEIAECYDHPFPKNLMFIKDGNLFTISDRSVDYQRTWNSFKFEE